MAKSPLERIKEIDAERAKLLDEAKATALANATSAVEELNALGFNYRLVQDGATATRAPRQASTGTRRSGIRDDVLATITDAGDDGASPADIRAKLGIPNEDKSGAQSVANALSALKKAGKISDKDGAYYAV